MEMPLKPKYQIAPGRWAPAGLRSMGRRSVCDPFDAAAIVERIATSETTAADPYRRYAA
jgi:hypothetical protein